MIIIINDNGDRLCKDNKWRSFAFFGSIKECVKIYKSPGYAKRKAKKIGGHAIQVPTQPERSISMDAFGKLTEEVPASPGYVTDVELDPMDFKIDPNSQTG